MRPHVNMNKYLNLKSIASTALLLLAFLTLLETPCLASEQPNIILAMADDQGWRDVAYNANPDRGLKTPYLDQMAREGIRFDEFRSSSPNCAPTRAGIMTGRYCERSGVFNPGFAMRPGELTIAQILQAAGYHTAHFGKWHLGPVKKDSLFDPHSKGFDYYLSHYDFFECDPKLSRNGGEPEVIPGDGSEGIVREALKYVDSTKSDGKPYFVVIWFGSPHLPHKPLQKYKDLYKGLPEEWANYFGEITGLDQAMGNLREGLKSRGMETNTLIWYTSDNGSYLPANHIEGLRGCKGEIWDGGVRVPGIIVWPGHITKPLETQFFANTLDIMPTILDLLGITLENRELDGMSILPLIQGKDMTTRTKPIPIWRNNPLAGSSVRNNPSIYSDEELQDYWHSYTCPHFTSPPDINTGHVAWIDGKWKLVNLNNRKALEFYDIVTDPGETTDLAAKNPEVVKNLKVEMENWQRSANASLAGLDKTEKPVVTINGKKTQF